MEQKIPTAADIRGRLVLLGHAQAKELSKISGVPFTTLWKIRSGETANPRIETVGQFFHLIESAKTRANESTSDAQPAPALAEPIALPEPWDGKERRTGPADRRAPPPDVEFIAMRAPAAEV